jgi:pyruvate, water dikinase
MITAAMSFAGLDERIDEASYGGKAAQLSVAARAGLPVPNGVALSVDCAAAVAAGEAGALRALEAATGSLRWPLAARSSAVGEDSATASFAGQHLTCLNVSSPAKLVEAVGAICASARAESAIAYRERMRIEGEPRIGVVAQELVPAERAGVLFSCNPIDGADELVIEATWGLGEAVVAGFVTPDRFRLSRDGRVLERAIGVKDVAIRPAPQGGTEQKEVPAELFRRACLEDSDLDRLRQLASRCEQAFGGKQDLEWAFAGDDLYLLQRRAVTHPVGGS